VVVARQVLRKVTRQTQGHPTLGQKVVTAQPQASVQYPQQVVVVVAVFSIALQTQYMVPPEVLVVVALLGATPVEQELLVLLLQVGQVWKMRVRLVRAVVAAARVARAFKEESDQFQVVDRASLSGELRLPVVVSDGNALDKIQRWVEMDVRVIPTIRITDLREIIHPQVLMEPDQVVVQEPLVGLVL
jgi:hypothetical protein